MGLRQAPTGPRAESPAPSSAAAAPSPRLSYRAITAAELTAMVHVLELACLLAEQARAAALAAGLLPLLLAQLPAAPPGLATACLDALLALQLRHPPAFVAFAEQQGVQQVRARWLGGREDGDRQRHVLSESVRWQQRALHACLRRVLAHPALAPLSSPRAATTGVPPAARQGHAGACARSCGAVPEPAAHSGGCCLLLVIRLLLSLRGCSAAMACHPGVGK